MGHMIEFDLLQKNLGEYSWSLRLISIVQLQFSYISLRSVVHTFSVGNVILIFDGS
jgi:hypothetical protein